MKVAIVGAGVMGQVLAFYLQSEGYSVSVFEQRVHDQVLNCSQAAAGLLTPQAEVEKHDRLIFDLGIVALQKHWQKLLSALPETVYFANYGSLVVAHPQDRLELQRFQERVETRLGLTPRSTQMNGAGIRQLEPELAHFEQGLFFPAEGQLDNQHLLRVLPSYLQSQGVQYHYGISIPFGFQGTGKALVGEGEEVYTEYMTEPESREQHSQNLKGEGYSQHFDWVIDCRGLAARNTFSDLRGQRGELIWLHAPQVQIQRPIRVCHPRYSLYVVPRPNGIYIIGASEIEAEDYSPISVQTTLELLSAAYFLHKGFAEARIVHTFTQCRPTLQDHLPRILYETGKIAINGLSRHGFLLAPTVAVDVIRYLQDGIHAVSYPQIWKPSYTL